MKTATVEVNVFFQAVRVFTKLSETTLSKSQRGSEGEWNLLGVWGGDVVFLKQDACIEALGSMGWLTVRERDPERQRLGDS